MIGEESVNQSQCLVDVYIITYNRAKYLRECIKSVLAQTYSNFELTILDNCSTDETEDIVREFNDNRLKYIKHERNLGSWGNVCYGFYGSQKKYFVIFHDDDMMSPTFLETEIFYMENTDISAISCKVLASDSECNYEDYEKMVGIKAVMLEEEHIDRYNGSRLFESYIRNRKAIMFPTIMYRTSFLREKKIAVKPEAGPSADMLLSLDIERFGGTIAEINYPLIFYRCHVGQDSQIKRVEMVCKLFEYMHKDSYYSERLEKYHKDQTKYFKRLIYNEICLFANQRIDYALLRQDLDAYESVLKISAIAQLEVSMVKSVCRFMPNLLKKIYAVGKGRKSRQYVDKKLEC